MPLSYMKEVDGPHWISLRLTLNTYNASNIVSFHLEQKSSRLSQKWGQLQYF